MDDFKLACRHADENKIWSMIRRKLTLEDPGPLIQYLGCGRRACGGQLAPEFRVPGGVLHIPGYKAKIGTATQHRAKCVEYDMVPVVGQFVDSYLHLAGIPVTKLSPKALTPFVDETDVFVREEPTGSFATPAINFCSRKPGVWESNAPHRWLHGVNHNVLQR